MSAPACKFCEAATRKLHKKIETKPGYILSHNQLHQ